MNNIFYVWCATGILFLLIEMFTATFYGLAISLAGFVVAAYVWFFGDTSVTLLQVAIFVLISGILSFLFPRYLRSNKPEIKTGLDRYVGQSYPLEQVGNDWKLKIEWVDYLISDDCVGDDFSVGKKVRVVSHQGVVLTVEAI